MKLYVLHAEDGSVLGFTDAYASAYGAAVQNELDAGERALISSPERRQKPGAKASGFFVVRPTYVIPAQAGIRGNWLDSPLSRA